MMSTEVIENFFGVYLLYCSNPKYKGRTYVGFTVNPNRRLKQHNAGQKFGGAYKTSNRGPWNMVLIIHGFPTTVSALRFEWAWQHPETSRRLKNVPKKRSKETTFDYKLVLLAEMLKIGPWCRLPLTLRWLDEEFGLKYSNQISAPMHMPIVHGKVVTDKSKKRKNKDKEILNCPIDSDDLNDVSICSICKSEVVNKEKLTCAKSDCFLRVHLICLAKSFCEDGAMLPVEGSCPLCKTHVLWGDLIKKQKGFNLNANGTSDQESSDTDEL